MVGRTPEYLGKKIEAREMKLAMLYVLVFPLIILGLTAVGRRRALRRLVAQQRGAARPLGDPLRVHAAAPATTARAFAGLNANTPFWNVTLGARDARRAVPDDHPGARHRRLDGGQEGRARRARAPSPPTAPLFTGLLSRVILIVGALTFFPALSLGPSSSTSSRSAGKVF